MGIRQTHTFVELQISPEAFEEIRSKLAAAEYFHLFDDNFGKGPLTVAMQGIALASPEWEKDRSKYYRQSGAVREKDVPLDIDKLKAKVLAELEDGPLSADMLRTRLGASKEELREAAWQLISSSAVGLTRQWHLTKDV